MIPFRSLAVMPPLPPELGKLALLARNFWWSWEPGADAVFRWLDEELWESLHHNPVAFLLALPPEKLAEAAHNPEYMEVYAECCARFEKYLSQPTWFEGTFPEQKDRVIAYLSAEYGIHECLPIYSGGLGLLAGDYLKAASDFGLPLVAVGLLYKFGYFNQEINPEGWQEARYPLLNFYKMPINLLTTNEGRELEVEVELSGRDTSRTVFLRVWQADLGRVKLYLLDADTPRNRMEDRQLTGRLYESDQEMRLIQEILLGIGGVRALRAVGVKPVVWHINEGHAAFSVLERLRELIDQGLDLETAREVVRASTIFTTHTPVPAGHDVFRAELLSRYLERFYPQGGLNWNAFLAPAYDPNRQGYNMTLLAHKHAYFTNAVSRLHGETTRRMFSHIYPGFPEPEIPVSTVTNGVHTETWVAPEWVEHFNRLAGDRWRTPHNSLEAWEKIAKMPAAEIWSVRKQLKARMLEKCRARLLTQRQRYFASPAQQKEVETYLPTDVLTIVFARRFTAYKRAYLLMRDREKLARLVNDPEQPVQFIFAGKAHPADRSGQEIIREIYKLSQEETFRGKIAFIEEYDIELARCLIQGADVWLNTPRRPLEASGTSGQKAVLNGTVHLSILDGWWPEAYNGKNGFAIGREEVLPNEAVQDYYDTLSLYTVLEEMVIPTYYRRTHGLPLDWIEIIREGWRTIPHYFNTGRMVKEYTERFYVPLMKRHDQLTKDNYAGARQVREFKEYLAQNWSAVAILSVATEKPTTLVSGQRMTVSATVRLGPIKPEDVVVEIVLGRSKDWQLTEMKSFRMEVAEALGDASYRFTGSVTLTQGTLGYTVRVRPEDSRFVAPFELPLVAWAPEF